MQPEDKDPQVLRDLFLDACPNAQALGPQTISRLLAGEDVRLTPNPNAASIDLGEAISFWQQYGAPFVQLISGFNAGLSIWKMLRPQRTGPDAQQQIDKLVDEVIAAHSDPNSGTKLDRAVLERAAWRLASRLKA